MKSVYKFTIAMGLALFVSACAKNDDNGVKPSGIPQTEKASAVDLSGKSVEEVLKIKYAKANLKCDLWAQQSAKLDISGTPTDSVLQIAAPKGRISDWP